MERLAPLKVISVNMNTKLANRFRVEIGLKIFGVLRLLRQISGRDGQIIVKPALRLAVQLVLALVAAHPHVAAARE
jgi:hypothetical protein